MATVIVFKLKAALVDAFTTALPTGWKVYNGQGASDDPGNFVMVGVGDPNSDQPELAASGSLEWAGLGHKSSKEESRIHCAAVAWSGDVGNAAMAAVEATIDAGMSAIETALRTDPNLGGAVPGLNWVRYAGDWSLTELVAPDGTAAIFQFDVTYFASL